MPLASTLLLHLLLATTAQTSTCPDQAACRQAALEAAERADFEAFHDLAWRAAQKGRPNDPDLMYILARAQSLSGRPGDALVMLRRLAQLGVATDAASNDDFRRVRALPGWSELEAMLSAVPPAPPRSAGTTPPAASAAAPPTPEPPVAPARRDPAATAARTRPEPVAPTKVPIPSAPAAAPAESPEPRATAGEEAMRLADVALSPIGLAYDSASRRFVVGDRRHNKLMVADEVFHHVNDLIGAASGGFGALSAVEIDGRRGDLWVTSTDEEGASSVHKLQLVSGRVLATIKAPVALQPVTFSDFAVTDAGALLLIDSRGTRLWQVRTSGDRFERPIALPSIATPSSIAPAGDTAYVAHAGGVSVVELSSGRLTSVRAAADVSLERLRRIRWSRGALIAIQGDEDGGRLVRIRLARGRPVATAIEPLDGDMKSTGTALTISRDAAYYIATTPNGPVIRRVPLTR